VRFLLDYVNIFLLLLAFTRGFKIDTNFSTNIKLVMKSAQLKLGVLTFYIEIDTYPWYNILGAKKWLQCISTEILKYLITI